MTRRSTLLALMAAAAAVALAGCGNDPGFHIGPYPVASASPITPTRTFIDGKGLRYLVDDTSHCVQIAFGDGTFTDCVDFTNVDELLVWRSGESVVSLLLAGPLRPTTITPGAGLVARWFTATDDQRSDDVDAIELQPGVYSMAYRSPVDQPIWGMQLRADDGGLLSVQPLVGQYLSAPR